MTSVLNNPTSKNAKIDEVRLLSQHQENVVVLAGHTYRLTRAEQIIFETRAVQRMSRLRQTGLAYLTVPTCENARLSHCLGTAYWTDRFLSEMRTNFYAARVGDKFNQIEGNLERLEYLDSLLGPTISLDLLARVYALVHDSDLLPFGHTLSYQLGYYAPPGNIPRFQKYLQQIANEVRTSPTLAAVEDPEERERILGCLHRHLDTVEAVATSINLLSGRPAGHSRQPETEVAALLPVYTFVETLVTAAVSTDLIDFAQRDTRAAGNAWQFDLDMLHYACVFATSPTEDEARLLDDATERRRGRKHILFRFGVNGIKDGRLDHRAVSHVIDLLRVRYEVLERIVYSPGKCVADAMLDRGIRNINAHHAGEPFPESDLLALGDDQFVDFLEAEEQKVNLPAGSAPVIGELKARRLWSEAYRLQDRSCLSEAGRATLREVHDPSERDAIEERLVTQLPTLMPADLVVSCLPLTVQMKDPDILIGWWDGEVVPLAELAATTGYGDESLAITRRYSSLWSFSIYTRRRTVQETDSVRDVAARIFER